MRAAGRFGRSPTVANPKGLSQEAPLELIELHLWLTAWPLGHERVEFEFENCNVCSRHKIFGGIAPGAGPYTRLCAGLTTFLLDLYFFLKNRLFRLFFSQTAGQKLTAS